MFGDFSDESKTRGFKSRKIGNRQNEKTQSHWKSTLGMRFSTKNPRVIGSITGVLLGRNISSSMVVKGWFIFFTLGSFVFTQFPVDIPIFFTSCGPCLEYDSCGKRLKPSNPIVSGCSMFNVQLNLETNQSVDPNLRVNTSSCFKRNMTGKSRFELTMMLIRVNQMVLILISWLEISNWWAQQLQQEKNFELAYCMKIMKWSTPNPKLTKNTWTYNILPRGSVTGTTRTSLRILNPPMETPDPPNDTFLGPSKQVVLRPHDIPRILSINTTQVIHALLEPHFSDSKGRNSLLAKEMYPHIYTYLRICIWQAHTVDGRNPASVDSYIVYPIIDRFLYIPSGAGFLPSTVPSFKWVLWNVSVIFCSHMR